jgi:hypothetical protein
MCLPVMPVKTGIQPRISGFRPGSSLQSLSSARVDGTGRARALPDTSPHRPAPEPGVTRILTLPETRDRFQAVDFNVVTSTPEAFDRMLRSDIEVFSKVAKAGGLIAK